MSAARPLARALTGSEANDPGIPLTCFVEDDSPAQTLTDAAAQLIVNDGSSAITSGNSTDFWNASTNRIVGPSLSGGDKLLVKVELTGTPSAGVPTVALQLADNAGAAVGLLQFRSTASGVTPQKITDDITIAVSQAILNAGGYQIQGQTSAGTTFALSNVRYMFSRYK